MNNVLADRHTYADTLQNTSVALDKLQDPGSTHHALLPPEWHRDLLYTASRHLPQYIYRALCYYHRHTSHMPDYSDTPHTSEIPHTHSLKMTKKTLLLVLNFLLNTSACKSFTL